jgi:hypothetical protein
VDSTSQALQYLAHGSSGMGAWLWMQEQAQEVERLERNAEAEEAGEPVEEEGAW